MTREKAMKLQSDLDRLWEKRRRNEAAYRRWQAGSSARDGSLISQEGREIENRINETVEALNRLADNRPLYPEES